MILKEANDVIDLYVYVDDSTQTAYTWDGKKFVPMSDNPQPSKPSNLSDSPKPYNPFSKNKSKQLQTDKQQSNSKQSQGKNQKQNTFGSDLQDGSDKSDKDLEIGKQGSKEDHDARMKKRQAELDSEGKAETPEEKEARILRIKDKFNDEKFKKAINQTNLQKQQQDRVEAEKNLKKFQDNPLESFQVSLYSFIKKQLVKEKNKSWSRLNIPALSYGQIKQGKAKVRSKHIPIINIYFDHSGSWDRTKIQVGKLALSVLREFERKKLLKVNLFYFSEHVHGDPESALREGGTNGQPILDHITETNPDNVIIMTDSDICDCKSTVVLPGALWLLWKGGQSSNLRDHIAGDQVTEEYKLDNVVADTNFDLDFMDSEIDELTDISEED